jgi:ABC-type multidrug transport system fused ATPase/permease subunit
VIETIRRSLLMLPAGARRRWALLVPLAVATGALEAGAAAAVLGLITIISDPAHAASLPVARAITPYLPAKTPGGIVLWFTALVVAYHVAKNVLLLAGHFFRQRVIAETQVALSVTMMRGYLNAPYAEVQLRNSSDLRRTTTGLPGAVCDVVTSVATLLSEWLVVAGLSLVLVRAAPAVSIVAGGAVALLLWIMLNRTKALAVRLGRLWHELAARTERVLQQAFGSVKEVKVLGREEYFWSRFAALQREGLRLGVLGATLAVVPPVIIETCFVVGALFVIALVAVSRSAGPEGLPLLAVFTYAAFRMVPAVNRILWRINSIRGQTTAIGSLFRDFQVIEPYSRTPPRASRARRGDWRTLTLEHVGFRYRGSDVDIFRDVKWQIRRGEVVGIVGRTGAGKTTLVDVMLGVLAPTSGRVLVDGVEHADPALGAAYVPQSVFIADDRLDRNVAFGVDETEIDDARVEASLKAAALEEVVRALPDGVRTLLGEHGARLSGGERQRVGIARALYHDPDLLVLDEATSALDSVTEARILEAIRRRDKAIVIVAHRMSTIRACNRLILLIGGRIGGEGDFDRLFHTNPEFRRLVEAAEAAGEVQAT